MPAPLLRLAPTRWHAVWAASVLWFAGAGAAAAAAVPPFDATPVPQRAAASAHLPPHWDRGAFMEIFVRAYQDSDGDGIGDLRGLISRLDYLKDLGIRGLWLMPVTRSADRDHGYATTDFRDIEPAYGTLADFDELLRQAHARGMGVIIDYVINHASHQHPAFQEALQGPDNPWRDWFVWAQDAPRGWDIWGKNPWYHAAAQPWAWTGELKDLPPAPPGAQGFYFGTFGPHMPDFNMRKPEVVNYHMDSLRFWLNRGLDGFRLDAVPHLIENNAQDWNDQPESRRLSRQLQDVIRAYPNRTVVCEATAEPQAYGDPAVCGGAFAFGYVHHFVKAARGDAESVTELARYYRTARPTMATFVSNHDRFAGLRLWDQVDGDAARYKLAAAGYLLQPGTPYIYYGEEVGQAGVNTLEGDLPLRGPMSWQPDAAGAGFTRGAPFRPVAPNVLTHNAQTQARDPHSILAFYKAMLALRNTRASIARGSFEHSFADGLVLGFQRRLQGERTVVLINYGTAPARVRVPDLPPGQALRSAHPAGGALAARVGRDGSATLQLAPLSVRVFDVAAAPAPVQAGQRPARSHEGAARPKPRPGQPG
ncbi:MAG: alpha-amylase family glycosyl hydrolase [Rubrivivax sp.]